MEEERPSEGEDVPVVGQYVRKSLRVRQAKRPRLDEGAAGNLRSPFGQRVPPQGWRKGIEGLLKLAEEALGGEEFAVLRRQYKEAGEANRPGEQDGIIVAVMAKGMLSERQIRAMFSVGPQRLARLRQARPQLPKVFCAGEVQVPVPILRGRYGKLQRKAALEFIKNIPSEHGFSCAHRFQREYLRTRFCRPSPA
jgi:hypothetical protein